MDNMLPLHNKRIVVTRGKQQAKGFAEKIVELGGIPVEIPLISIIPANYTHENKMVVNKLHEYQWLIFSSANGVHFFFQQFQEQLDCNVLFPKIAVVGKRTLEALQQYGHEASVVPKQFVQESLLEALYPYLNSRNRILNVRGNLSRDTIKSQLINSGYDVTDLVVYQTIENSESKHKLYRMLTNGDIDVITFASSSAVKNFVSLLSGHSIAHYIRGCIVACIGPITKETATNLGITVHICPKEYTLDSMLQELVLYYNRVSN
ncbi:uroporphyrinogen-III synthase [Cytobacillus sp. IB215316]|uniref:uroporphyrinogen-III synthase n=1 Tax=Cytobacillus sp. IB215316 TaxID=3097354 RepID=UPI002A0AE0C7|nr:uroporphyrinogen-III synthase [Cytobacillus sp. IB215316]MDX8359403.1 uroporphyrinogen-III synthase [Cytobacillus sp. IB215316]